MENLTLSIPAKELKGLIKQVLREQLKENSSTLTELENELITRKEACRLLRISMATLHIWTNQGLLTSYKAGLKRVMYKRSEVLGALKRKGAQNG